VNPDSVPAENLIKVGKGGGKKARFAVVLSMCWSDWCVWSEKTMFRPWFEPVTVESAVVPAYRRTKLVSTVCFVLFCGCDWCWCWSVCWFVVLCVCQGG